MANSLIEPRILKGFRDSLPQLAIPRQEMISRLSAIFSAYGFVPIDTPALEYAEILLGKGSAETDKQMYRFADNGGRDVALRFDLTIPLARFVAAHINDLGTPFKRYHIAPVWRAEKPQRGRYREFIQCDFDIIGTRSVLADTEILLVIHAAMKAIGVAHKIRLNNRQILNGLLQSIGAREKSASVLRAIDKLEKLGAEVVIAELKDEAALSPEQIDSVFSFMNLCQADTSNAELLRALRERFKSNEQALKGVIDLEQVLNYALAAGLEDNLVQVDLSIARGLDYYTGIVYETVLLDLPQIGSICSGGRYDNLASLYTSRELPGVGASVGLDRILGALEELGKLSAKSSTAQVLVTLLDESSVGRCLSLADQLRSSGIPTEVYPEIGRLGNQLKYGGKKGIRWAVIAGELELQNNACALKNLETGEQRNDIPLARLIADLKSAIG